MFKWIKWIEYSNVKVSLDLNPWCWSFKFHYQRPVQTDPHLRIVYWRILPLSLTLVFDNGYFVPWEESIIPEGMCTGGDSI